MRIAVAPLIALKLQLWHMADMEEPTQLPLMQTHEWAPLRPELTILYMQKDKTIAEIQTWLAQTKGRRATLPMIRERLEEEWDLKKKITLAEAQVVHRIGEHRKDLGKETIFVLRGRQVDMGNVYRTLKQTKLVVHDVPFSPADMDAIPDLTCYTPPSSPSLGRNGPKSIVWPVPLPNVTIPSAALPKTAFGHDSGPGRSNARYDTPASSLDSSPYLVPRTIDPPPTLGRRNVFLQQTKSAFDIFYASGFWSVTKSSEMPWKPTRCNQTADPSPAPYYFQDECNRHLNNGVELIRKGDVSTAYQEWNEAVHMLKFVVKARHYNTLIKMLGCVHLLQQNDFNLQAQVFCDYLSHYAERELKTGHPYRQLFSTLRHLTNEDFEQLQTDVLEILVEKLESKDAIGEEAFTSFEHRMVLNQKKLDKDPNLNINDYLPTKERCDQKFGPASSKTLLALNMRRGILEHRGKLGEAYQTTLKIIATAEQVKDPAKRLWHLTSAWMELGRIEAGINGFTGAVMKSLEKAWLLEVELRTKYGFIKLGDGEINWLFENVGQQPWFKHAHEEILSLDSLSLA